VAEAPRSFLTSDETENQDKVKELQEWVNSKWNCCKRKKSSVRLCSSVEKIAFATERRGLLL